MPASDYYVGAAFFAVVFGAIGAASVLIVRKCVPQLGGVTRALALGLVASAGVLAVHVGPAALGLLSREAVAVVAVCLLALAWWLPAPPPTPVVGLPEPAAEERAADRLLARFALWACGIWFVLAGLAQLQAEPIGFDAASAYLPAAARWMQEGSLWGLADWLPNFFYGASPGNGSMMFLAGALPWENDFLAHYAIYPFIALTALALHVAAREAGATRSLATLLGLMVAAVPVLVEPAMRSALLDPVLYAGFAAAVAFLLRHHRTGETGSLALAGVGLGIAFGTKLYGFTAVPIVLAVWAIARLAARRSAREVFAQLGVLAVLITAFGGIWVVRNAVDTGNPAFPVEIGIGQTTIFDAPEDPLRPLIGSTLAGYFTDPGAWTGELRRQFRVATGIPVLVLGLGTLAALALLVRRRRRSEEDGSDGVVIAALAAVALLALSYAATPYSAAGPPGEPVMAAANVRYGVPAMIVAVVATGWMATRLPARWLLAFEALAVLAIFDALRVGVTTPRATTYGAFALAALIVGAGALVRRRRRPREDRHRRWPRAPRSAVAAALALALAGLAVLGESIQRTYNESRYIGRDAALDWLIANSGSGLRVGVTGAWTDRGVAPIYPAFGTRLQNDVDYVGPKRDGLLGTYENAGDFQRALAEEGFEVLIVGRALPFTGEIAPSGVPDPVAVPREERWARAAGFERVAESERFVTLRRS